MIEDRNLHYIYIYTYICIYIPIYIYSIYLNIYIIESIYMCVCVQLFFPQELVEKQTDIISTFWIYNH